MLEHTLVVRSATTATTILNGMAGNDVMIGGVNDQLYGGDGNDTLLANNGAAYLAGQAGNDILFNAFKGISASPAVVMLGGSGTDTFALIGDNTASGAVTMNTTIADLSSGDKIDLSFLESGNNTLVMANLNGKVSLTSAGAVVNLSGFDISSSETGVIANLNGQPSTTSDANSLLSAASKLTVSSAKASATATAIESGFSTSSQDFNALFGTLTDTYQLS